ncbi:MAG: M24 family metallopeptidase, partial [Bacteroidaceae bacterium]|nr:M24 family metallopeptidase [Bacteroidaceae bacterium]
PIADSPVALLKAVKNEVETEGFRRAMVRDGVALVRFLRWLLPAVAEGGQTEMSIDRKLTALRAEQPLFHGISFDTIAGYGAHGAIVHYEATPETDAPLAPEGLLLLDSGAQYLDGTTDITRTIALGPVTPEQKHHYTLVLKGNIQLSRAVFPEGTTGTQLDVLARSFMWRKHLNYLHGTGHGVGSFLNVHEGPHQIRMNWMGTPLKAGMTVTDEPGLYIEGSHGVRIENMLLVVGDGEGMFGGYNRFEVLTLCPIDTTPVDWSLMTPDEVEWLNSYHATVFSRLSPHLTAEECEWLREATKPVKL